MIEKHGDITDETPGIKQAAEKDEHPATKASETVREATKTALAETNVEYDQALKRLAKLAKAKKPAKPE